MTQGALIQYVADRQALYMQAKQTRSDILYMTTLDTGRCSHIHTYRHTYKHTYIHTYIHTHVQNPFSKEPGKRSDGSPIFHAASPAHGPGPSQEGRRCCRRALGRPGQGRLVGFGSSDSACSCVCLLVYTYIYIYIYIVYIYIYVCRCLCIHICIYIYVYAKHTSMTFSPYIHIYIPMYLGLCFICI